MKKALARNNQAGAVRPACENRIFSQDKIISTVIAPLL
jgi:hypothetical protein